MSVKFDGVEAFKKRMEELKNNMRDKVDEELNKTCQMLETEIKSDTPVVTGYLRNSVGYQKVKENSPDKISYAIYVDADYSPHVEKIYSLRGKSFFNQNITRGFIIARENLKDGMRYTLKRR